MKHTNIQVQLEPTAHVQTDSHPFNPLPNQAYTTPMQVYTTLLQSENKWSQLFIFQFSSLFFSGLLLGLPPLCQKVKDCFRITSHFPN